MNRGEKRKMRTKRGFIKDDKAFTGLEAAIVLTAFIVVAAVFSYMVLGAGFFSTEKAKAVVHTGVQSATSSMEISGDVIGHGWLNAGGTDYFTAHGADTTNLTVVELQVQLTAGQEPIDMNKVVLSYSDADAYVAQLDYRVDAGSDTTRGKFTASSWNYTVATPEVGAANMLESNEKIDIIVTLPGSGAQAYDAFIIDIKPGQGGAIALSRMVPGAIDLSMPLY